MIDAVRGFAAIELYFDKILKQNRNYILTLSC